MTVMSYITILHVHCILYTCIHILYDDKCTHFEDILPVEDHTELLSV